MKTNKDRRALLFLTGLTLAGIGSSLLTSIFSLFHVETYLRVYKLPLPWYASGSFIFSMINTANDVLGSWLIDDVTQTSRSKYVGISVCIFAIATTAPFHLWTSRLGLHFVASMSIYDTMYSFTAILMGSVISDDHEMTEQTRVGFIMANKSVGMVVSFLVAKTALGVFATNDLGLFQRFLWQVVAGVCVIAMVGQTLMNANTNEVMVRTSSPSSSKSLKSSRRLRIRRVLKDFWNHPNFCYWLGMEMLMEAQNTFLGSFIKTFMDRLVVEGGVNQGFCDWILSISRPARDVVGLAVFIPIRLFGYHVVYQTLFLINLGLAALCLLFVSIHQSYHILCFLVLYNILSSSISSAGFGLAMADMVLEMKHQRAASGRLREPSLAGLFMGMNALFCKPMEGLLPVIAAHALQGTHYLQRGDETSRQVLFYLLVLPPLIFSILQIICWRRYDLTKEKVKQLKAELREIETRSSQETQFDSSSDP